MRLPHNDPLAVMVVEAIRKGDTTTLNRLLGEHPNLANARIVQPCNNGGGTEGRTLLHIAADWPGHFPNGAQTVAMLASHEADLNVPFEGFHAETPLHWAASSGDVSVLDALLDAGADIESPGSIFANGTAVADAVAFGQWNAAWRLVERGARTNLWQAAGLGLLDRVESYFSGEPPTAQEITSAFWSACHGGQLGTAEYLLNRGANINWIGYDGLTPVDAAQRSGANAVVEWLRVRGGKSTKELQ